MEKKGQNINGVNNTPAERPAHEVRTKMPSCLTMQVAKRAGCAVLMTIISTIMIVTSKNWGYAIGYLIAAGFFYLAFDIIWKFRNGMIYVAKMIVCKTHRSLKGHISVTVRSAAIDKISAQEVETYRIALNVPMRERANITPGTVMNIYISENSPSVALAYECLGEVNA